METEANKSTSEQTEAASSPKEPPNALEEPLEATATGATATGSAPDDGTKETEVPKHSFTQVLKPHDSATGADTTPTPIIIQSDVPQKTPRGAAPSLFSAAAAVMAALPTKKVPHVDFELTGTEADIALKKAVFASMRTDSVVSDPSTPGLANIRSARLSSLIEPTVEATTQNAHAVTWEQIMHLLDTNAETGLTTEEAMKRLVVFGRNKLAEAPPEPFWHKVFRQINSILIYILLIAACIAGGFEEWAEFGLILGVVVVNVTIGLIQEGKAERATAALKAMLSSKATVIRDGERKEINAEEVVPGDLVFIESGNKVPADLRLVEVSNLALLESMLTGESLPVNKKTTRFPLKSGLGDRKNMAFSATNCIKGQGKGIVVATGDETQIGKINQSVSEVKESKTQLIRQVDAFGVWIGMMVVPVAIASFLLAYFTGDEKRNVSYAFIEAIAIAVAIIPEGLPAIITITLSLGTSHMAKHHAIVKALPSVETLGSVMVICSDKTGTLTKNEMTVVSARTAQYLYRVDKVGYDPAGGKITPEGVEGEAGEDVALKELIDGGVLCNDSRIERVTIKDEEVVQPVGDPTEVALVTFGEKADTKAEELRRSKPRIGVIPFESEHKFMCTFHADPNDANSVIVYAKGAPDRLIVRSSLQMTKDGQTEPADIEFWQAQAATLSEQGLRCLAVCTATISKSNLKEALAQGASFVSSAPAPFLTFVGLAAIMDPPRDECIQSIKDAHSAGIVVKMITGDHPGTARAIGKILTLVDDEHPMVITGPELDEMTMDELRSVVLKCNVYARASPENKISIVRALQAEGQVSSMTGDGVNDAPALRAADIGVAMGITGTDVSKDAAKMILTDDNFTTILVAVKEGRRVWDNLKKLLIFNMPASFAQGGVVFFALCLQWETVPLSAIQILYVNMITACTLGLMLAVEPAEEDIMQRPPRKTTERLIGLFFYWRTVFVSAIFIFFVLGAVAWLNAMADPVVTPIVKNVTQADGSIQTVTTFKTVRAVSEPLQHAIALNTLVFCETAYAFNCRFLKQSSLHYRIFFGNRTAWICATVMIGLQFLITYVPGLNKFFSMEDTMTGEAWGITIFFAVMVFLIVELEKFLQDPLKPYVKPCIKRFNKAFCSCRCSRLRRVPCFKDIDYVPDVQPKPQLAIHPKLKSGGSLKFIPDELVQEAV